MSAQKDSGADECPKCGRRGTYRPGRRACDGFPADLELQAHQQPLHIPPHRAGLRDLWPVVSGDCNTHRTDEPSAMRDNEILQEIRRVREEHASECYYDVHVMFEQMRAGTEQLKAEGWKVVPPTVAQEASAVIREEPPKP
jgi:hypothetical protein